MHTDARYLDDNTLIEGDICIVGAGAAGISIALELMKHGKTIILLEGGGFRYDERMQELLDGTITGQPYYPLKSTRLHYFGGTTGHWGGYCATFDPIDFKKRDWVPNSGWPITFEDLVPFYKQAHNILDLGVYEYGPSYWQNLNPEFVPLSFPSNDVWNKIWRFSPPTRMGEKYRNVITDSEKIKLFTYAKVVNIVTNETVTAVKELEIKNFAGKSQRVKARSYILACNSIENARLLLSSNQQAKAGLGNDHDLAGRYFMEHIEIKSAELWLTKPNALKFYMVNSSARLELAISEEKQFEHQILNGTASLTPLSIARRIEPLIDTWSHEDPRESKRHSDESYQKARGKKIQRFIDSHNHNAYQLMTRIEQAPSPLSRIVLNNERDELGMQRVTLNWVLSSLEKRSIRKMYEIIGMQIGAAGIGRIKLLDYLLDEKDDSWPQFTSGGWHHMGTTRMSNDPKTGVVDKNCKVHGIQNLYVTGSSCFTTGGAVNPTLTLTALALRLAHHIKEVEFPLL
jgi:choline dehydrogenase-like flavoprotein